MHLSSTCNETNGHTLTAHTYYRRAHCTCDTYFAHPKSTLASYSAHCSLSGSSSSGTDSHSQPYGYIHWPPYPLYLISSHRTIWRPCSLSRSQVWLTTAGTVHTSSSVGLFCPTQPSWRHDSCSTGMNRTTPSWWRTAVPRAAGRQAGWSTLRPGPSPTASSCCTCCACCTTAAWTSTRCVRYSTRLVSRAGRFALTRRPSARIECWVNQALILTTGLETRPWSVWISSLRVAQSRIKSIKTNCQCLK